MCSTRTQWAENQSNLCNHSFVFLVSLERYAEEWLFSKEKYECKLKGEWLFCFRQRLLCVFSDCASMDLLLSGSSSVHILLNTTTSKTAWNHSFIWNYFHRVDIVFKVLLLSLKIQAKNLQWILKEYLPHHSEAIWSLRGEDAAGTSGKSFVWRTQGWVLESLKENRIC